MRVYTECDFREPKGEYIRIAAIQCEHGKVFTGARHPSVRVLILGTKFWREKRVDGFVTSGGRFVDRIEAARIAYAAGQIPEPVVSLYSEDLY